MYENVSIINLIMTWDFIFFLLFVTKFKAVSRDAELIVNCNMNYPTIKVKQIKKDSTELLQVEYICKNITTQDEVRSRVQQYIYK